MTSYVFIDTSYLIFYRYHALRNWMSLAHPEVDCDVPDITGVSEFVEAWRSTFFQGAEKVLRQAGFLPERPRKTKRNEKELADFDRNLYNNVVFVRDCPSDQVWRREHVVAYKGTRDYSSFNGGRLFSITYNTILPEYVARGARVVQYDRLEADDVIALFVEGIRVQSETDPILILTNDNDYLQLLRFPNVYLWNLKGQNLRDRSTGDPYHDLMRKVVLGDPSDNLPRVFSKCGPKRLAAYIQDSTLLETDLSKDPEARHRYESNLRMIDFRMIPETFRQTVLDSLPIQFPYLQERHESL